MFLFHVLMWGRFSLLVTVGSVFVFSLCFTGCQNNSCTDVWQMSVGVLQRVTWQSGGGVYPHSVGRWGVWTSAVCRGELMWWRGVHWQSVKTWHHRNRWVQAQILFSSWFLLSVFVCRRLPPWAFTAFVSVCRSRFTSVVLIFIFCFTLTSLCSWDFFRFPSGFVWQLNSSRLFYCLVFPVFCFIICANRNNTTLHDMKMFVVIKQLIVRSQLFREEHRVKLFVNKC